MAKHVDYMSVLRGQVDEQVRQWLASGADRDSDTAAEPGPTRATSGPAATATPAALAAHPSDRPSPSRPPRAIILSRSQYILLEDYCIAREVTAWLDAISRWVQAPPHRRAKAAKACKATAARRIALSKEGVVYLTCNAGNLRIRLADEGEDEAKLPRLV